MKRRALVACSVALLLVGCGSSSAKPDRPTTVNATGVVTQKNRPLSLVLVMCRPEGGNVACSAITDENGVFALSAFNPDPGAIPGKYSVAVLSTQQPTEHAEDVMVDRKVKPKRQAPPLPLKYSKFETSGLTIEIPPEGTAGLKIELEE